MLTTRTLTLSALLAAGMISLTPAAQAFDAETAVNPNDTAAVRTKLPVPQVEGDVTYITGGFGDEERIAIAQQRKEYNLHVTNTGEHGVFVGNGNIMISNRDGDVLVNTEAGPLFEAKLPPGRYTIEATNADQKIVKQVTISSGRSSKIDFKWRS